EWTRPRTMDGRVASPPACRNGIVLDRIREFTLRLMEHRPSMHTILVIEDESALLHLVRDYLNRGGFHAITASNATDGQRRIRADEPDLVILDLGLPDG